MTWHTPLAMRLIQTSAGDSFRDMPLGATGLPLAPHPGAFGVRRKHHTHEGVDLYAPVGTAVLAVEAGTVVRVAPFTGPAAGLAHWHDTQAVFVEGDSGVVVYGEISPCVEEGAKVSPGQEVGFVVRVLLNDKGRPMSMLHLELHTAGSRIAPEWLEHDNRPEVLRDPTPFLVAAAAAHDEDAPLAELSNTFNPFSVGDSEVMAQKIADMMPAANEFLQQRTQYLRSLWKLQPGWLGGGGKDSGLAPSKEACGHALEILYRLAGSPFSPEVNAKTVLMGPLEAGGVTIELRLRPGFQLIVALNNDLTAELFVTTGTGFTEIETTSAGAADAVMAQLDAVLTVGEPS